MFRNSEIIQGLKDKFSVFNLKFTPDLFNWTDQQSEILALLESLTEKELYELLVELTLESLPNIEHFPSESLLRHFKRDWRSQNHNGSDANELQAFFHLLLPAAKQRLIKAADTLLIDLICARTPSEVINEFRAVVTSPSPLGLDPVKICEAVMDNSLPVEIRSECAELAHSLKFRNMPAVSPCFWAQCDFTELPIAYVLYLISFDQYLTLRFMRKNELYGKIQSAPFFPVDTDECGPRYHLTGVLEDIITYHASDAASKESIATMFGKLPQWLKDYILEKEYFICEDDAHLFKGDEEYRTKVIEGLKSKETIEV